MPAPFNPGEIMESQNPYIAGDAVVASPPRQFTGELAGKGRRFGTLLVDHALYYVLCGVIGVIVVLAFGEDAVQGGRAYLISIPVFLAYYAGFEGALGRTPGKFLFGTRVVTNAGGPPSFGQALGRTLSRMIPFEPFSVLFASDGETIGWHDSIARTKVIRVR